MTNTPRDARLVIDTLLQQSGVAHTHSPAADAEAQAWLAKPGIDDPDLVDLEHLPFVTMDNAGSRDLDQALHVAPEPETGGWQLQYALADAAYYVTPGSALWEDALERGASLYAPTRALAMLPVSLSEGLVSLNPGVARRALVIGVHVDGDGRILNSSVMRARIRSRLQLTYEGVQALADGRGSLDDARAANPASLACQTGDDSSAILASLNALQAMGAALQAAQARRGVTPFDRTESEVHVSGEPAVFDSEPRARLDSERWNEQLSLACNMQGAALLEALEVDDASLEPIFRVHDAPGSGRLKDLESTLDALAERLSLERPWRRDRKSEPSLANWFAALPDTAPRLKRAIQRQMLRAQNASNYEGAAGRHHALAADAYARFSSPMREVVGIHTHLVALDALGIQKNTSARSTELRDAVIAAAEAAKARQKALDRAILFEVIHDVFAADLDAMTKDSNAPRWHTGTLLGMDHRKLHIGLDGTALDIKLYKEDLQTSTDCDWTFDSVSATPSNDALDTFVLGDGVRVRVIAFHEDRQRFCFELRSIGNRPSLRDKRRSAKRKNKTRRISRARRARQE